MCLRFSVAICVGLFGARMALAQNESELKEARSAATRLLVDAEEACTRKAFDTASQLALEAAQRAADAYAIQQRAAEILYRSGRSQASLPLFERAIKLAPELAPHNWQRGIALCSCGEFEKGAEQFKTHHDVNPDDVENSAWYFLCIAKVKGIEAARKTVIPSRGDGREPMMSILGMLKGELAPADVLQAAIENTPQGAVRQRAQFYADLYVALYYDSLDQADDARAYLKRSLNYDHSGYMVDVARVYLADRFPENKESTR